jgi:DNA-binding PadR family transcriptional regulator
MIMHRYDRDHGDSRQVRGLGFGARHHGHARGGRDGRRGRVFDHGDLRFVLLRLIAEQPRHGYELIKAIEEAFGGTYSPSPGVIYPTLTLLEEVGYVRSEEESGGRKRYAVTDEGAAFLAANRAVADAIVARMAEASRTYGGGPAPEIRRALRNLEEALAIRLGRGPLDEAQVRAIAAVLDHAAGEVERS